MRKRWIATLVALGIGGGALGYGLTAATAGSSEPEAIAAPAVANELGQAFGTGFTAKMSGTIEVPPGDPDATGTALIRLNAAEGLVCFKLVVTNADTLTAAHIHRAPAGQAGPVVIPLTTPTPTAADANVQQSKGCVSADVALINEIKANPANFYANTHNKGFPAGAVRGQLEKLKEKAVKKATCKAKKKKKKGR
jgi:CHRD domain